MIKVTLKSGGIEERDGVLVMNVGATGELELFGKKRSISSGRDILAIYACGEWVKVEWDAEQG